MQHASVVEWAGLDSMDWTPTGLLGLFVLMVFFGWLIPRWTYKALERDRDDWKGIAMHLKDTNHLLAQAAKENTEPTKTVAKVMRTAQDLLSPEELAEGGDSATS